MKIFCFILFVIVLLINNSCLRRQFVEGSYEIKSISDTALNDSCQIFGRISHVDWSGKEIYYENEFQIGIENTAIKTTNDTTGSYFIKTIPGAYTIKCQHTYNPWERLAEKADIELQKNKKMEIDFYIGYTIE